MAVYKVPQDVEADDKLIGPFSFRQFIYLMIVAASIALGFGLFKLFPPLVVIPLPIVIFFGALALPLRKDQPMEIYLAAVVSFFLKPRKRLWQPDGIQSLVEITAPKVIEIQRAKDLSQREAEQRLSYLANIVDTQGWAVRGVSGVPDSTSSIQSDVFLAAQQAEDILDDTSGVAKSFDTMITQADAKRRDQMTQRMHVAAPEPRTVTPPPIVDPYAAFSAATPITTSDDGGTAVTFDPYPEDIHQSMIRPLSEQAAAVARSTKQPTPNRSKTTSENPVSPDIINLANNPDLSIETIAHEANRIHQREVDRPDSEVVISLR